MDSFVGLIRQISNKEMERQSPADLFTGVVTSASPLKIKIDGRLELGENFLMTSALCKENVKTIDGQRVVIWRGLQTGDKVRMLRCGHGQLYYILDREGVY